MKPNQKIPATDPEAPVVAVATMMDQATGVAEEDIMMVVDMVVDMEAEEEDMMIEVDMEEEEEDTTTEVDMGEVDTEVEDTEEVGVVMMIVVDMVKVAEDTVGVEVDTVEVVDITMDTVEVVVSFKNNGVADMKVTNIFCISSIPLHKWNVKDILVGKEFVGFVCSRESVMISLYGLRFVVKFWLIPFYELFGVMEMMFGIS
mmetsp:Transcript_7553/g.10824  ORF Transcript_7553/g.10824 Transcript_7553/m.10824 type:complete len:202 (-) Transcript_7553:1672-2277(-)